MPTDIERTKSWVKIEIAVREMIVNPIGERSPVGAFSLFISIGKPWNYHASRCAFKAIRIAAVPDMAGVVTFV